MKATNGAGGPCRFCGRLPRSGAPRVPGPAGPICLDCVRAGLRVVGDGEERTNEAGERLDAVSDLQAPVCEFCGRRERRTFLGFRRPLVRLRCAPRDAVICVDCLDSAGDALNLALRS
ncbi:hypothetical protein VA596_18380 [Amycolatopsis sp., V23-08]|uniref:ClpX-type ZB domain-containing protein n=1 Tax=Amycolatopsis heterodermiae TaxID=3110235 RepID=A0ABU5R5K6_9PSEU|nr:hypothetical protein [Amycolatopsis sp., V23-08]MEA5361517.1 hypothetical protein [Amycolatopsis sp., V23-08]